MICVNTIFERQGKFEQVPNRGHALTIDHGWREVADKALAFVGRFVPADGRATAGFAFPAAGRGRGADKVSCLSCHTLMPYALGRPALRHIASDRQPTELEDRVIAQVRRRVAHWDELDTPRFKLFYDFDDAKKGESRGTESVLKGALAVGLARARDLVFERAVSADQSTH